MKARYGMTARRFFTERLLVAAAPGFADDNMDPMQLRTLPYIRITSRPVSFWIWAWTLGLEFAQPESVRVFHTYEELIAAALHGLGYGIFLDILIECELSIGALVQLSPHIAVLGAAYYLLYPSERSSSETARAFHDGLLERVLSRENNLVDWRRTKARAAQSSRISHWESGEQQCSYIDTNR